MKQKISLILLLTGLVLTSCGGTDTSNEGNTSNEPGVKNVYQSNDEFIKAVEVLKANSVTKIRKNEGHLVSQEPNESVYDGLPSYERLEGLYRYEISSMEDEPRITISRDNNHFFYDAGNLTSYGSPISYGSERAFDEMLVPTYYEYEREGTEWKVDILERASSYYFNRWNYADNNAEKFINAEDILCHAYFANVYERQEYIGWDTPRFNSIDAKRYFELSLNSEGVSTYPLEYGIYLNDWINFSFFDFTDDYNTWIPYRPDNSAYFVDNVEFKIREDLSIEYMQYDVVVANQTTLEAYGYRVEVRDLGENSVVMDLCNLGIENSRKNDGKNHVLSNVDDLVLPDNFTLEYVANKSIIHIEATRSTILFDIEYIEDDMHHHDLVAHNIENGEMYDYFSSVTREGEVFPWDIAKSSDTADAYEQLALYVSNAYRYLDEDYKWERAFFKDSRISYSEYNQMYELIYTVDGSGHYQNESVEYATVENNVLTQATLQSYFTTATDIYLFDVNNTEIDLNEYLNTARDRIN